MTLEEEIKKVMALFGFDYLVARNHVLCRRHLSSKGH